MVNTSDIEDADAVGVGSPDAEAPRRAIVIIEQGVIH